jgi:hypothetical protein
MPLVSVIIPTYNRAELVGEAIDSVLAQTHRDLEVIVVDDGSTDHTSEVLRRYGDSIRPIHRRNGGQSVARNTGLGHARGEYIAFLDSDDLFLPRKLELQLRGFDRFPGAGMICSRSIRFENERGVGDRLPGEEVGEVASEMQDLFEDMLLLKRAPLIHDTLVRRSCFTDVGNFDEQLHVAVDHDMWLRISAHCQVAFIDAAVAAYRQHSNQLSNAGRVQGEYVAGLDHILDKLTGELPAARQTPQTYRAIRRARALVDVHRACYTLLSQDRGAGIERLRRTLSSGELLAEDAAQVSSIVVSYAVAADAEDASCSQSLDLLHTVWGSLPPPYRHLRRRLRRHLAFRHHHRACLAAKRGGRMAAMAEAVRWLRYREPWRAPMFVRSALRAAGVGTGSNHV